MHLDVTMTKTQVQNIFNVKQVDIYLRMELIMILFYYSYI